MGDCKQRQWEIVGAATGLVCMTALQTRPEDGILSPSYSVYIWTNGPINVEQSFFLTFSRKSNCSYHEGLHSIVPRNPRSLCPTGPGGAVAEVEAAAREELLK